MKIVAISDTHIRPGGKPLPGFLIESIRLQSPDMIIHCGDIATEGVIYELETVAPVSAVSGNVDPPDLFWRLKQKLILDADGARIGVIHGYGSSDAMTNARQAFLDEEVDCIVFGHSHNPVIETVESVLCVNPGSPIYFKRPYVKDKRPSYAVIKIDKHIEAEIVYITIDES